MSYRGFTIEQERDGSYSIFNLGYVAGHFSTIQAAKENIDWRMDYHGRGMVFRSSRAAQRPLAEAP